MKSAARPNCQLLGRKGSSIEREKFSFKFNTNSTVKKNIGSGETLNSVEKRRFCLGGITPFSMHKQAASDLHPKFQSRVSVFDRSEQHPPYRVLESMKDNAAQE